MIESGGAGVFQRKGVLGDLAPTAAARRTWVQNRLSDSRFFKDELMMNAKHEITTYILIC